MLAGMLQHHGEHGTTKSPKPPWVHSDLSKRSRDRAPGGAHPTTGHARQNPAES